MSIRGKAAIVTGGGSGIGLEIARSLLDSGTKVIITGRFEDKLAAVGCKLGCSWIVHDNRNVSNLLDFIIECEQQLGTPIDILVNNAGIYRPEPLKRLLEIDEETYTDVMDTNLKGTYFLMQQYIKYSLIKKIPSNILNISSCAAYEPIRGPYGLSKLGVISLTQSYGKFFADKGIVINGIAPGVVATRMNNWKPGDPLDFKSPTGRMITVEEVSQLAIYLLSNEASQLIGETVLIDGAWSKR